MLWLSHVALEPSTLYLFIKNYLLQIVATLLAIIGFALRLRGLRRTSTVIILLVYFIIYVLPALIRSF